MLKIANYSHLNIKTKKGENIKVNKIYHTADMEACDDMRYQFYHESILVLLICDWYLFNSKAKITIGAGVGVMNFRKSIMFLIWRRRKSLWMEKEGITIY